MSEAASQTGGCQCGAIRYRFNAPFIEVSLCHCRMCQKATGGLFGAFAGGFRDDFELTRGTLTVFRSSDSVERGFCPACGTPLTFGRVGGKRISVTMGSLDHPEAFPPTEQAGWTGHLAFVGALAELPNIAPIEDVAPELAQRIRASNHQHPDHDTAVWPPTE